MTKPDLLDWVGLYNCDVIPLAEHKARVILLRHRESKKEAFIYLPIDNKPMKDFTVCKICSNLGIPIPTHAQHVKEMHDYLKRMHEDEE